MPKSDDAGKKLSAANLVALQNLRVIRRRLNDKTWQREATKDLRRVKADMVLRKPPTYGEKRGKKPKIEITEAEVIEAVDSLVEKYLLAGLITSDWKKGSKAPLPEHPTSRKAFAEAAGVSEGHLREVEEMRQELTLDDAIAFARVGDMDLATFLTPAMEDLESTDYFPLTPVNPRVGHIYIYEWLLWLKGYRKLPGQNEENFIRFTSEPHPLMSRFDDTRRGRWQDEIDRERVLIEESDVFVGHLIEDGATTNPFKSDRTPFEQQHKRSTMSKTARLILIQSIFIVSTQVKRLFLTKERGSLKSKSSRWTKRLDFVRHGISTIVTILIKLGK